MTSKLTAGIPQMTASTARRSSARSANSVGLRDGGVPATGCVGWAEIVNVSATATTAMLNVVIERLVFMSVIPRSFDRYRGITFGIAYLLPIAFAEG